MKKTGTMDERFREFHKTNPRVYLELEKLALEAKRRGRTRIGIKMIWEVVRWNMTIATDDPDFKLNNNYHSRYARLLVSKHPEMGSMFAMRELRS